MKRLEAGMYFSCPCDSTLESSNLQEDLLCLKDSLSWWGWHGGVHTQPGHHRKQRTRLEVEPGES